MILVAKQDLNGPFAGIPVVCRPVQGDQRWLIAFDLVSADGTRDEHRITCPQPVPLSLIGQVAEQSINELLASGSITARAASWRAYFQPRSSQRKAPRKRR